MAEIISLQNVIQARRRQQEQDTLRTCIAVIEHSLKVHIEEFPQAPEQEWTIRAKRIRQLGELLEYATQLT
ncbi:MAG: hypothetical protein AB7G75_08180 [Candidatus Binatia bacterium]